MLHPLGPLAEHLPALAEYECAQVEMRHGIAASQAGESDTAAVEFHSASRSAERLARMADELAPEQARRWRDVAEQRAEFAAQARTHTVRGEAVTSA